MAYASGAPRGLALALSFAGALCVAATGWAGTPGGESAEAGGAGVTMVMVEQAGCYHCRAWHAEIGPAWPNTAAGRHAPLRTEQLRAIPEDLQLARRVSFTPTFVIVDGAGRELGRLEGYPGADFFWPMIEQVLAAQAGFVPDATN